MLNAFIRYRFVFFGLAQLMALLRAVLYDKTCIPFFMGVWFAACAIGCSSVKISADAIKILHQKMETPVEIYPKVSTYIILFIIAFSLSIICITGSLLVQLPFNFNTRLAFLVFSIVFLVPAFSALTQYVISKTCSISKLSSSQKYGEDSDSQCGE